MKKYLTADSKHLGDTIPYNIYRFPRFHHVEKPSEVFLRLDSGGKPSLSPNRGVSARSAQVHEVLNRKFGVGEKGLCRIALSLESAGDVELALYVGSLASCPRVGSTMTVGGVSVVLISRIESGSTSLASLGMSEATEGLESEDADSESEVENCRTAHIKGTLS